MKLSVAGLSDINFILSRHGVKHSRSYDLHVVETCEHFSIYDFLHPQKPQRLAIRTLAYILFKLCDDVVLIVGVWKQSTKAIPISPVHYLLLASSTPDSALDIFNQLRTVLE